MTGRYVPVPVWNNRVGQWEPVDFRHGQHVAAWPNGFDLARLPLPDYRDGDRVQFVRDESCTREGGVRMVLLQAGLVGLVGYGIGVGAAGLFSMLGWSDSNSGMEQRK